MDDFDIFAGVADFCENFTPEVSKFSALEIHPGSESSSSDAETIFAGKKKAKAINARKKQTQAKIKRKTGISDDIENTTVKTKSKKTNDENHTAINASVPEITSLNSSRRRQTHQMNGTDFIEAYMQRQTATTLAIQMAPETSSGQRGRGGRRSNPGRACRRHVIATIDLAGPKTPPLPPRNSKRKNKKISVDLDNVFESPKTNLCADDSFDFENEEMGVKIRWGDEIEIIPLRRHQKFADLMQVLAQKKNVLVKDILLNINNKIIGPNDTIDSLNYNIAQFISGRNLVNNDCYVPTKKKDRNVIKVKIQSNAFKKPLEFPMKRDQQFKILYIKCSEELKISCDSIKLSFDGDPLILTETPNDLDLEGGEVIDCRIKQ